MNYIVPVLAILFYLFVFYICAKNVYLALRTGEVANLKSSGNRTYCVDSVSYEKKDKNPFSYWLQVICCSLIAIRMVLCIYETIVTVLTQT